MKTFPYAHRDALLAEAARLRVEIPYSNEVGILLDPFIAGGRSYANRCAIQPMEGCDGELDGAPGELTARRYARFAAGGSGLIWFEATAVAPDVRSSPRQLCLTAETLDRFRRLVEETRAAARAPQGGSQEVVLILQLTHAGRWRRDAAGRPAPVLAQRHPVLDEALGAPAGQALVTDEELDRLQDDFVDAAERAAAAGFDGVDVKACHGYLLSELLGAHGRADSRYGGSFENRTRLLRETLERTRARLPSLLLACRLNAWDGLPYPFGFGTDREKPERPDFAEAEELARRLAALGCGLLNVTLGHPRVLPHLGRPFDAALAGAPAPPEHPLAGVARLLEAAARVQRAAPEVPVVGTGYSWLRQHFPHVGAAVVRQGGAAFIGAGRNAFACPDFPRRLARRGRLEEGELCIACSRCSQMMRDGGRAGCAVRDREVYLPELRAGRRRAQRAGAPGPAGRKARGS